MKNYVDIMVTDYGSFPINTKIVDAYKKRYQKLRAGKPTKKSLLRAGHELAKDMNVVARVCWIADMDGIPKEFIG